MQGSVSTRINQLSNAKTLFNHSEYVTHVEFFITEEELMAGALSEVQSLLFDHDKLDTVWIAEEEEQYFFKGCNLKKPVNLMSKFPFIKAIMDQLNASGLTTGDLNSCLVTRYPNGYSKLNWHSDDEGAQIRQSSSIASFTLLENTGDSRKLQMRKKLQHKVKKRKTTKLPVLAEYELGHGSVVVMKPGCQDVLEHRVPAASKPCGVRFALSFRHFICKDNVSSCSSDIYHSGGEFSPSMPESPIVEEVDTPVKVTQPPSGPPPSPKPETLPSAIIMAGDSFMKGLKTDKLKKGKRINIFNLAESGHSIKQVKRSVVNFSKSGEASKYQIRKVFFSIGTNDIKHYDKNGVTHLKNPISDLLRTTKELYPLAEIYVQSLIPLPVNNRKFIVEDLDELNKIIYDACCKQRCWMMDAMTVMLNEYYVRNPSLFKRNNIHPNASGYSVLAQLYIRAIHSERFYPFGW